MVWYTDHRYEQAKNQACLLCLENFYTRSHIAVNKDVIYNLSDFLRPAVCITQEMQTRNFIWANRFCAKGKFVFPWSQKNAMDVEDWYLLTSVRFLSLIVK